MAQTDGGAHRGTGKRKEQPGAQAGAAGVPEDSQTSSTGKSQTAPSSSTAELGVMMLAFIFGALGFALRIFWIPAMVAMAVVFGLLLADRRATRKKGVVAEIVGTVVNEAREIMEAASGTAQSDSEAKTTDSTGDAGSAEALPQGRENAVPATIRLARSNGHAPSGQGASVVTAVDSHVRTIDLVEAGERDAEAPALLSVERKEEFVERQDAVATETRETECAEAASEGSSVDESDGAVELEPQSGPAPGPAGVPAAMFPFRLLVSADRVVAGNSLLRPVRRRALEMATSLSQAIVQLGATPPDGAAG
jgi:hypothetical protein